MIRINLLPFRTARKKENIRRQLSMALLMLFFISLALVYYNLVLNNRISTLDNQIQDTKKQVETYRRDAKKVDDIKKKLANLEKKTNVINNLELNREWPVRLLETMTVAIVPKRMWFTRFSSKGDQIIVNGVALDNKTVADFMTRLEGTGLFVSVNLNTLERKKIGKMPNLKGYKITCKRAPLKKAAPAKEAKKK